MQVKDICVPVQAILVPGAGHCKVNLNKDRPMHTIQAAPVSALGVIFRKLTSCIFVEMWNYIMIVANIFRF